MSLKITVATAVANLQWAVAVAIEIAVEAVEKAVFVA